MSDLGGAGGVYAPAPVWKDPPPPSASARFRPLSPPRYMQTAPTSAHKKTHSVERVFSWRGARLTLDVVIICKSLG